MPGPVRAGAKGNSRPAHVPERSQGKSQPCANPERLSHQCASQRDEYKDAGAKTQAVGKVKHEIAHV